MLKLFRYLKKAYVPVIAIVLLLILQASCDLTLPTFTSNIVNVGIQQKGIEDAVPDVMREETFLALKSLMKQDDADDMEDAYKLYTKDQVKDSKYKDYKDGRLYVRRYISKKDREHLDTSMSKAMLKLSAQMAKQIQANPQAAASLSKSQKKMMAQMKNMDTKDMPDTIISQAAISFVTSEYKAIGLDIDQMQTQMDDLGFTNAFIGTVEGEPEDTACDKVIEKVKEAGFKNVILRPLMVVAGDHANNDMAGDDADSWKSQFEASGDFDSVDCQIAGLGRIAAVEDLYVAHTKAAIDSLGASDDAAAEDTDAKATDDSADDAQADDAAETTADTAEADAE